MFYCDCHILFSVIHNLVCLFLNHLFLVCNMKDLCLTHAMFLCCHQCHNYCYYQGPASVGALEEEDAEAHTFPVQFLRLPAERIGLFQIICDLEDEKAWTEQV